MLTLPSSKCRDEVCSVRIISPNRVLGVPASAFLTPDIPGSTTYSDTPCLCFLIEHKTQRLVFDLGIPKDLEVLHPAMQQAVKDMGITVDTPRSIPAILSDEGLAPSDIEGIVLSHHHFDHVGDPTLFPAASTSLIVGPGFKKQFVPGYPDRADNVSISQAALDGRTIHELDFSKDETTKHKVHSIGGIGAIDWFGDGSLWLLDTPGHAVGHLSALVRTTASSDASEEDTWVFLAGDVCHHAGELRPSADHRLHSTCMGLLSVHPQGCDDQPFYEPAQGPWHLDPEKLKETTSLLQRFDADPNVFVLMSHDHWLLDMIDLFPKTVNAWKQKNWDEQTRWRFLKDFEGAKSAARKLSQ